MLFYRDCSETWRRSLIARRELAREQTVLTSCAVRRPVFEEDEPGVKNVGIDEFEARPWIAGIDRLPASGAEDHGKDHEPEPVDKSKLHHAPHETDAANRSKWISRLVKMVAYPLSEPLAEIPATAVLSRVTSSGDKS